MISWSWLWHSLRSYHDISPRHYTRYKLMMRHYTIYSQHHPPQNNYQGFQSSINAATLYKIQVNRATLFNEFSYLSTPSALMVTWTFNVDGEAMFVHKIVYNQKFDIQTWSPLKLLSSKAVRAHPARTPTVSISFLFLHFFAIFICFVCVFWIYQCFNFV